MGAGHRYANKVIVVTGASRGLGAALVQEALAAGASVASCARGEQPLATPERQLTRQLSVTDGAAMAAFAAATVARFGAIDLWVNNAGVLGPVGPLRSADMGALGEALQVNVLGVALGSQLYAQHCRVAGRNGVLINLSSGAARRAYAGWCAYCGSKAAVDRLSEVVALEEPLLRVHALAPGVFESDMQVQLRGLQADVFPEVAKFQGLHRDGALLSPVAVAQKLLSFAFGTSDKNGQVCLDLRDL